MAGNAEALFTPVFPCLLKLQRTSHMKDTFMKPSLKNACATIPEVANMTHEAYLIYHSVQNEMVVDLFLLSIYLRGVGTNSLFRSASL